MSRRTFLLATTAVLAAGCVRTEGGARVGLGAGEQGGLYLAFAELLTGRLGTRYPDLGVDAVSTEGTVDNLAQLRSSTLGMGLALADVAERDRATGPAETAPLAVARVYENYLQVIVRDSGPVRRLVDLRGLRVSIGPAGSGAAATSEVLFAAAGLGGQVDKRRYRLHDGLERLADGSIEALVWSGGVPTPAISDLDAALPVRMLDIGELAAPMAELSGYPYLARGVPAGEYVPPGLRSIGVPNLLLCRHDMADDVIAAVVDVLATDAPQLVPPSVRGLQYLDPPSMIQTGLVPLHPGAVSAYRKLHG
ncbi:TAXI family TRAP transporter solute-binding subunit [Mycolicibacterium sp. P9-64]|uniref:TAXI family TRAP transporter solute-binding subunit n=1 Tax=Mycolicibacterium sp. P9-64 TaxID=2024612 RepID=UPI0011EBD190|nr:TAXI family TRAP transporter solute-binding subunit [Mycolicibacterium sp. P9-64]KAA0081813.1 TAXI family TRAP transporter solute-binding subunit [Mycolicibacterium sp. P9-64]